MPLTINIQKLWDQKYRDESVPFPVDGTGGGAINESDVTGLVSDLAAKAPLASPAFTGNPTAPTQSPATNNTRVATTAYVDAAILAGGGSGTDALAVHYLNYDTTGVAGASSALQTAIDAGHRAIVIPPGTFKCDAAVFDDLEDGNASLYLACHGVQFVATTSLPTVAEFELYNTNRGFNTGTKWFLFPSTYRAGLSSGVVTTVGHSVTGTTTLGGPKSGVHPHLVVDGGSWSGRDITNFNAGFCHTNTGGAAELRSMHMNGARTLLGTGSNYIDGNKMRNCSGWEVIATLDNSYDMALFYQYGSGDGVEIMGCKCANYILTAKLLSCNSATLASNVSGAFYLEGSHGIHIIANHCESANNITNGPRRPYWIKDSHVTIESSFDYLSNTTTDGAVYIDDSGFEGKHSTVQIHNYFGRRFLDPSTSDPVTGPAIYLNNMNDRTTISVHNSWSQVSASDATFGQSYGAIGLPVGGNASNEPTVAAAVANGRDHIGSGSFKIYKYSASTVGTGQNVAMTIGIAPHGNMGRFYSAAAHVTPTSYDSEAYGATGTLTNGTSYAYAFAVCNTLPDGTIEYGQATAERLIAAGAKQVIVTELYMPSAGAAGATLVVWRKTGTGVIATPDRYVVLPVGSAATRLFDTGANISGTPWITTSVPVPSSVAATNHTSSRPFFDGTAITVP
jgi:hypothetical protein